MSLLFLSDEFMFHVETKINIFIINLLYLDEAKVIRLQIYNDDVLKPLCDTLIHIEKVTEKYGIKIALILSQSAYRRDDTLIEFIWLILDEEDEDAVITVPMSISNIENDERNKKNKKRICNAFQSRSAWGMRVCFRLQHHILPSTTALNKLAIGPKSTIIRFIFLLKKYPAIAYKSKNKLVLLTCFKRKNLNIADCIDVLLLKTEEVPKIKSM